MRKTIILMTAASALAIGAAQAEPLGGSVVGGSATIDVKGKTTTIDQSTEHAIIEWQGFDVAGNERVNFNQPSEAAIALNRVLGPGASVIDGQINANGRVFIINGDGVVFGDKAKIDVNGLLVSTTDIADAAFLAGDYVFDQPGAPDAAIENRGTITAASEGMIALVAPNVENSGVLRAKLGQIALGAGDAFTLDFFGDNLVSFAVSDIEGTRTASILQTGVIDAESGSILLLASAARDFVDTIINIESDLVARSASMEGGRIVLTGGAQSTIAVDATLDARGTPGGEIVISGGVVDIAPGAELLTDAQTGKADAGDIAVHSVERTEFAGLASAEPGAAEGAGGDISITSEGVVVFTGEARAGDPPREGTITIGFADDGDDDGSGDGDGGDTGGGDGGGGDGDGSGGGDTGGGDGNDGGDQGGGNAGDGDEPVVAVSPGIKEETAERIAEVQGAALPEPSRAAGAGAAVLFEGEVAFDIGAGAPPAGGEDARLMCLHGVAPAACGGD